MHKYKQAKTNTEVHKYTPGFVFFVKPAHKGRLELRIESLIIHYRHLAFGTAQCAGQRKVTKSDGSHRSPFVECHGDKAAPQTSLARIPVISLMSQTYGRDGPHRLWLDNDIDLTMTLSNHRGTAMWAAWKEGSLELEVGFDKLNLSDRAEAD